MSAVVEECSAEVVIRNKLGLHARPAAALVKLAQGYPLAELRIGRPDGAEVNGKSIMGVLTLAAARGQKLLLKAWGEGACELVDALVALIEGRFGEVE